MKRTAERGVDFRRHGHGIPRPTHDEIRAHEFDEYDTLIIEESRIPVTAGEEYVIPRGTPHAGEVLKIKH